MRAGTKANAETEAEANKRRQYLARCVVEVRAGVAQQTSGISRCRAAPAHVGVGARRATRARARSGMHKIMTVASFIRVVKWRSGNGTGVEPVEASGDIAFAAPLQCDAMRWSSLIGQLLPKQKKRKRDLRFECQFEMQIQFRKRKS